MNFARRTVRKRLGFVGPTPTMVTTETDNIEDRRRLPGSRAPDGGAVNGIKNLYSTRVRATERALIAKRMERQPKLRRGEPF